MKISSHFACGKPAINKKKLQTSPERFYLPCEQNAGIKKIIKRVLYAILFMVVAVCVAGLTLAYWPTEWKIKNKGVTPEKVAVLRQHPKSKIG
jgi:hypothetical protein